MRYILAVVALVIIAVLLMFFSSSIMQVKEPSSGPISSPSTAEVTESDVSLSKGNSKAPTVSKDAGQKQFYGEVATTQTDRVFEEGRVPQGAMERAMLSNGMLNESAIQMLQSKQFDNLLTQFERQQDDMGVELTAAYRAQFQSLLKSSKAPSQIDRIVCGTDVCIASIRTSDRNWYGTWMESVQNQSVLPINALTGRAIELGGSSVEYRLLFSTSENVKGFSGSAPKA